MVSACGTTKFLIVSLLSIYSLYLFTYKCSNLNESALEHSAETILHPISHTHSQLCDGLNGGVNFINPYLTQAGGFLESFLDTHVHSHPYFKQYEVESKLTFAKSKVTCAKCQYNKYVHPYVLQLWQLIEVIEVQVYDQLVNAYEIAKVQYYTHVSPKVEEIKAKYL